MQWFYNMKLGKKLIMAFMFLSVITLFIGIQSIFRLGKMDEMIEDLYKKETLGISLIKEANLELIYFSRAVSNYLLCSTESEQAIHLKKMDEYETRLKDYLEKTKEVLRTEKGNELLSQFAKEWSDYKSLHAEIIQLGSKGNESAKKENLLQIQSQGREKINNLDSILSDLADMKEKIGETTFSTSKELYIDSRLFLLILILSGLALSIGIGIFIARSISKPIIKLADIAGRMSKGEIDVEINEKETKDEIGVLIGSFNSMITSTKEQVIIADKISDGNLTSTINIRSEKDMLGKSLVKVTESLKSLEDESMLLSKAAVEGKLSVRGNNDKFNGAYKEIISGVNRTLDAVIGPLNVAAEYIDRISKGDIPIKITDTYNGDFNEIKNNLNTCIDAVSLLIKDANILAKAAIEGKLAVRADITKHQGDFRAIVEGVNNTLDSVIGPLNVAAEYVDRIAKGDIPARITDNYNGDFNEIKNNLNTCIDAVNALVSDAHKLSKAAIEGKLSTRADATKHQGDFRKIVEGVNDTLDAVIGPLNVAAEYVDRISKGDIPAKISDNYNGDFNEIKNNLNTCIDAVSLLVKDANFLAQAAVEGRLAARADASKHQGDFKEIVEGVNKTLDAVIGPLNVAAEYVDRIAKGDIPQKITDNYNGDFNEIKNNLNTCIDAVNLLVTDANLLSKAAIEGKLSTRADATKHQGDFRKIVEGVNATLDAVISPLKIASTYIENLSKRNLAIKITEEFSGDFNELKDNLNQTIESIQFLIEDANMLANSAIEGNLAVRADLLRHTGEYRKIIGGFNNTLDTVLGPIKEGVSVLEKMGLGDLTVRINSDYKGDHQLIKNSINAVAESLSKTLSEVNEAIEATASASNQISSSTEEMAAGAHEQTQQTSEVASGVEEMTKTILENTKNASNAAEAAKNAGQKAQSGGKIVLETIEGMNRIAEVVKKSANTVQELGKSSDQIGEIVQVIDDIADQTNLLALNAAIEAARAGEQGRGFAVVADEVRKLAERTTKATKEIAAMIRQIQKDTSNAVFSMEEGTKEVEKGKTLANQAGVSLKEIVDGSQNLVDLVGQVATASEQQSSTAEEISKSIDAISSVSVQSAAGTQQIARAAEDLNRLTLNLENLISQFSLGNNTGSKKLSIGQGNLKKERMLN